MYKLAENTNNPSSVILTNNFVSVDTIRLDVLPACIYFRRRPKVGRRVIAGRRFASAPCLVMTGWDGPPADGHPNAVLDEDETEIADYRAGDLSQDEMLQLWYDNHKLTAKSHSCSDLSDDRRDDGCGADHERRPIELRFQFFNGDENTTTRSQNQRLTALHMNAILKLFPPQSGCNVRGNERTKRLLWIDKTHEMGEDQLLLERHRLFTARRANRPRRMLARLRLGYCVSYAGECVVGQRCLNMCDKCGVCSHRYDCTCRLTRMFGWCNHKHLAVQCGRNLFGNDTLVYVHNSSRTMQLAHLRATCYDWQQDVVQESENVFRVWEWGVHENRFSYQVLRLEYVRVCVMCPRYKRCHQCHICRHMYRCECDDYRGEKLLCEHCHVVAIHQRTEFDRVSMLTSREYYYLDDLSDITDEDLDSSGCSDTEERRQGRIVRAHHEQSNAIYRDRISTSTSDRGLSTIFTVDAPNGEFYTVYQLKNSSCICFENEGSTICLSCCLCRHQLVCNCSHIRGLMCKHEHAVCRYMKVSGTTQGEMSGNLLHINCPTGLQDPRNAQNCVQKSVKPITETKLRKSVESKESENLKDNQKNEQKEKAKRKKKASKGKKNK